MLASRLETLASHDPDSPFSKDAALQISYSEAVLKSKTIAAWVQKQAFFDTSQPLFTYFEAKAAYLPIILGVMQSGMPWVGLDPTFPAGHNRRLLSLVPAPIVIAPSEYQKDAGRFNAGERFFLAEEILSHDDHSPRFMPDPDSTALVTFTSGSTQRPKGVMRSHRDVFENATAQATAFGYSSSDCAAGGYSPNVMGFLRAFLNIVSVGGCYRPFQFLDNGQDGLLSVLRNSEASALHIVAPVFRAIFSSLPDTDKFESIRKLILGGDAATPADLHLFCRYFSDNSELFSALGSSESGTISTWRGGRDYLPEREKLPCGKLLPAVKVLLDIDGEIGEPIANEVGELLVSSPGVAQKYWMDEGLTRQKWISTEGGRRYCRTGDLVSFDEMGILHHFGRSDSVAKVNGFLVDPAYVEFILCQHPHVVEAAVEIDTESNRGKPVVEAFLVLTPEFEKADLDSFLADNIHDAAKPAILYRMPELPRTKNGKLVRSSLDRSEPFSTVANARQGMRSDLDTLRAVWAKTLEIEDIGDDANFITLGGDSLKVIILTLEVEREFDVRFSVHEISAALNLSEMARVIEDKKSDIVAETKLTPAELISNVLSSWKGEKVDDGGFIRQMSESGQGRLYWCLQSEREFLSLNEALENKVTLRVVRSLNLLVKRSAENSNSVAEIYADAILSAHGNCGLPVNLGGNCQGSTLMLLVAKILHDRGVKIGHFIMMEKFSDEPLPFPVTILFGEKSERNLFRSGELTPEYAKQKYPCLRGIYEIAGEHGQFFSTGNVGSLSREVLAALDTR